MSSLGWSLQLSAVVLSAIGVAYTVLMLVRSHRAQRDWTDAARRELSADEAKHLAELLAHFQQISERKRDTMTEEERRHLAQAVRSILTEMSRRNALPDRSVGVLWSALDQPSETGREEFARKLASDAVRERLVPT